MYLSHIRIKSFRNFEDFEVPFQSGLNLVVGENNIGKSNLFDALRIALGYAAFGRAALRAQRSDLHRNDKGEIATTFEIHLEFTGVSKEDLAT
jgi:putative ATP-dependent endonuclease of the OLD family